MLGCYRWQVDKLKVHVLVRHHACVGVLGRKRIRRDTRPRSREPRMQRGLARIRRSDQPDLRCAFGADHQRRAAMSSALPGTLEFFAKVLDARLDICLEVLGPFVLGDGTQHLPQPLKALPRVAALTEGGLSRLVFGREIGGHDYYRSKERILRPYVAFEGDLPLRARCACEGGCQREQPVH